MTAHRKHSWLRRIDPARLPVESLLDAMEQDLGVGVCLACYEEQDQVEPDGQGLLCESCGEHAVYGVEIIVMAVPSTVFGGAEDDVQ
jgi:hypothetical protein